MNKPQMNTYLIGLAVIWLLTLSIIVAAFVLMGSPTKEQTRRLDMNRISAFQSLYYDIEMYYMDNDKLPNSLNELDYVENLNDPETKKPFVYRITSSTSFELCTTFSGNSSDYKELRSYYSSSSNNISFNKGYDCIKYSVKSNPNYSNIDTNTPNSDDITIRVNTPARNNTVSLCRGSTYMVSWESEADDLVSVSLRLENDDTENQYSIATDIKPGTLGADKKIRGTYRWTVGQGEGGVTIPAASGYFFSIDGTLSRTYNTGEPIVTSNIGNTFIITDCNSNTSQPTLKPLPTSTPTPQAI